MQKWIFLFLSSSFGFLNPAYSWDRSSAGLAPAPNSNTFISYIIRKTPEFYTELPPHAIGKDWIEQGSLFGVSESGTGVQFSLFGLLGFTLGLGEGIELNLLGMSFGVDILSPALKFPFVGKIGFADAPVFDHSDKE